MKNKNTNNFIIISFIIFILSIIINISLNNYYKNRYNKIVNNNINGIVGIIKDKYPNIKDEEIIKIINSETINNNLKKYGIDNNSSSINSLNKEYKNNLIVSNIIISVIFIIYILLFIINMKKRDKNIKKLVKVIEKINNKDYSLEINYNSEDELSNLKNELYKVTIMLKNEALNKEIEKEVIKNGVANISHQIKTPLTSIAILIDNIIEDKDMEDSIRQEFLKDIRRTIDDINYLVVSLLKLARFDAHVIKLKGEKINASLLIEKVVSKLKNIGDLKNIKYNINVDKNIYFIGDFMWEVEAISNILKNAIEYSNNDGSIDIDVVKNNFYTKITIKDHGRGMKGKDIKNIFKRFYKGEASDINSYGIGLSLSNTIIENDNGFIKVKSSVNEGTTFEIKYMNR